MGEPWVNAKTPLLANKQGSHTFHTGTGHARRVAAEPVTSIHMYWGVNIGREPVSGQTEWADKMEVSKPSGVGLLPCSAQSSAQEAQAGWGGHRCVKSMRPKQQPGTIVNSPIDDKLVVVVFIP